MTEARSYLNRAMRSPRDAVEAYVCHAYASLTDGFTTPFQHVRLLQTFNTTSCLRFIHKSFVEQFEAALDTNGFLGDDLLALTSDDFDRFDADRHVLVATDLTPLWWLSSERLRARGYVARLVSPLRKSALLYWHAKQ